MLRARALGHPAARAPVLLQEAAHVLDEDAVLEGLLEDLHR